MRIKSDHWKTALMVQLLTPSCRGRNESRLIKQLHSDVQSNSALLKMRICKQKMDRVQDPQHWLVARLLNIEKQTPCNGTRRTRILFSADCAGKRVPSSQKGIYLSDISKSIRVKKWFCLVCNGPYSTMKSDWVPCFMCDKWARCWLRLCRVSFGASFWNK